jgi:ABC-2 type transport system ATP-binding protein
VEHVCDRVGIVRGGRLIATAGLDELRGLRAQHVEVEFAGAPPASAVRAAAGVDGVVVAGRRLSCTVRGSVEPLLRAIAGHAPLTFISREPSLEEQFLRLYGDDTHPRRACAGEGSGQ